MEMIDRIADALQIREQDVRRIFGDSPGLWPASASPRLSGLALREFRAKRILTEVEKASLEAYITWAYASASRHHDGRVVLTHGRPRRDTPSMRKIADVTDVTR